MISWVARLSACLRDLDREMLVFLGLSTFAWMPLLAPGYFLEAHDAPHTLFFLRQFDQALRDGYLIPRWGTDFALGYGYPLFLFYSPLAYYVAESFYLLGASITLAIKLTYLLAFVLSGLCMYYLGRRLFGRSAGLLAALLYVYAPYHLLDVYVRSALTESFAFIFMPLTMLAMCKLIEEGGLRNVAWASLSYAGLILSHNGTALVFTPLLALYILFLLMRRGRLSGLREAITSAARGLSAAGLAAGASAFFLIPAFVERRYIIEEQWIQGSFDYLKHFIYPSQFFSPFWGYGYAGEGLTDEMSFQLGVIPVCFSLAALSLMWKMPRRRGDRAFFAAATIAILCLMLPLSAAIWDLVPIAAFVQFPWRLLILTSFTLSLVGCSLLTCAREPSRGDLHAPGIILGIIVAVGSYALTLPEYTERSPRSEEPVAVIDFETHFPPDRVGMVQWTKEQPWTSPLVPQYLAGEPLVTARALSGDAYIEMIRRGGHSEEILVRAATPVVIEFFTYYFPGWRAFVDGRPTDIQPTSPHGLISLQLPAGEHHVAIRFGDTPIRTASKVISAVSLLVVGGLFLLTPVWATRISRVCAR